ncbi:MAG: hypothetical protein ACRDOK_04095, partial [Streptosporangiaceae bacterium]
LRPPPAGSGRQPREPGRPRPRQAARGQSGTARGESGQRAAASGKPGPWQGQPMSGPLARRPDEPEQRMPFWLRPVRRK